MKKGILISVFTLLFIAIIGSVLIYFSATSPIKKGEEAAIERAKSETNLAEVISVDWFHYIDSYFVIEGKDVKGKTIHIWVPEDKKRDMIVKNANEGLTKDEVIDIAYNGLEDFSSDKRPKQIIHIKLGMVDNAPAYEVTYKDQMNRHGILYIDYYKGDWYRVYNL